MTVRERNVSIDIAKSICMFLIMMGHLIGQTNIKTINNYGEAFIYSYMIVFLRQLFLFYYFGFLNQLPKLMNLS